MRRFPERVVGDSEGLRDVIEQHDRNFVYDRITVAARASQRVHAAFERVMIARADQGSRQAGIHRSSA
jgi:hypothetical protein